MKIRLKGVVAGTLLSVMVLPSFASYEVKKGDSLSLIAKRHYGTFEKWHDLWAINRAKISNPDLIYPGSRLRLLDEKNSSLVASNDDFYVPPQNRSQEWRLLPIQPWEKFTFRVDPQIDPDGFDRRSRVPTRVADNITAEMTVASDRIPIVGEVASARSEFARLFVGEQILIHADEPLQVGEIYAITPGPERMISPRDGRVGFAYAINGRVRIIGVREGLFIGTLISLADPVLRNQLLIPNVTPFIFPQPVAADQPLAATVMVPSEQQENLLTQEQIVFLDVGLDDGIKPGMIFRQFVHTDPYTHQEISSKDFIIESELQVLRAQDKFSIALILNSLSNLKYGDEVVALTDLADFKNHNGLQKVIQDRGQVKSIDELDKMDVTEGLGEKENRDLRQLEKWNKPSPEVAPAPSLDSLDQDEIKKIEPREPPSSKVLGHEVAPNDGSGQETTAPETMTPEETTPPEISSPETAPEEPSATPSETPAEMPSNEAPPPLMGDETIPMTDEPANGVPSGEDPFATPAPPEP